MQSISLLLKRLEATYPNLKFIEGNTFHWNVSTQTITYASNTPNGVAYLLHELSHALLGHTSFDRDITLLSMEREAWERAHSIASNLSISIDQDLVEDSLDSYRNWLHARSTCPSCNATGVQIRSHTYSCLACLQRWTVNDARTCQLRRFKQQEYTP